MAAGRRLSVYLNNVITVQYERTDKPLAPVGLTDNFQYDGLCKLLNDGKEVNQIDLLYHNRRTFTPPGPDLIDLDTELTNSWGDILNFYTVKLIVVKNRETGNKFLALAFKSESLYVGPNGCRLIVEPGLMGIQAQGDSSPGFLGNLIVDAPVQIEYDLIIAGTSNIVNVSSSP